MSKKPKLPRTGDLIEYYVDRKMISRYLVTATSKYHDPENFFPDLIGSYITCVVLYHISSKYINYSTNIHVLNKDMTGYVVAGSHHQFKIVSSVEETDVACF